MYVLYYNIITSLQPRSALRCVFVVYFVLLRSILFLLCRDSYEELMKQDFVVPPIAQQSVFLYFLIVG